MSFSRPRPDASDSGCDAFDLWIDPGMTNVAAASEPLKPRDARLMRCDPINTQVAICCGRRKKGRIIRDQVWIARRKEHHPEGRYFLECYQGGKRRRYSVGGFENVVDGARRKAIELWTIRVGLIRPQEEPPRDDESLISIAAAISGSSAEGSFEPTISTHDPRVSHVVSST